MAQSPITLEILPPEVKIIILNSLPDVRTLLALIEASPDMLRLYCRSRDHIYALVVRNEIGENLIRQALFLRRDPKPCYSLRDYVLGSVEMEMDDTKALLRDEQLTRNVIQACVHDELGREVELSDIEWLRLRRGFYNFRVAVRLAQGEDYYADFQDINPFCQMRTPYEILEMLYILYLLRNRFRKHLSSLEDAMLHGLMYDALEPDFDYDHSIFAKLRSDDLFLWNSDGPWQHDLRFLHEQCQVPADWSQWSMLPEYDEHVEPIHTLETSVPVGHDFEDAEGSGFLWLKQQRLAGHEPVYDYHHAIPLGYMIWDDERLKSMSWMRKPPPLSPIEEKWRTSYQHYKSVEERFNDVRLLSIRRGKKLNTWYNQVAKSSDDGN